VTALPRRRILLADDSVTIQKVVELTFMEDDFEVRAVGDGDEALALLTSNKVDLVIADIYMPGASGYDVCRRSKELQQTTTRLGYSEAAVRQLSRGLRCLRPEFHR
jgi:CheY-like chemotaxis protein